MIWISSVVMKQYFTVGKKPDYMIVFQWLTISAELGCYPRRLKANESMCFVRLCVRWGRGGEWVGYKEKERLRGAWNTVI